MAERNSPTPPSNTAASEPADRVLNLTRVFDAPRSLVYQALTRREHLMRWCAPHHFTVTHGEGDLRPGGAWRSCMVAPDGVEHWVGGVYRELVPDERVVFTHTWEGDDDKAGHETLVSMVLSDEAGPSDEAGRMKTKLTFHQATFKSAGTRDGHEGGWTQAFERLGEHLHEIQSNQAR